MKTSQFFGLMGTIYIAPHVHQTGALLGFVVCAAFALACRYGNND
jgi:hypothetical protein